MNRVTKNVIMIVLLILLCVCVFLTINYNSKEIINDNHMMNIKMPNGERGDMPADFGGKSGENFTFNGDELPDKINDDFRNNMRGVQTLNVNSNNTIINYVLLGLESLGISLIIIYLIISSFNKKNLKVVFKTSDKITIYILSSIVLTGILTVGLSLVPKENINNLLFNNTEKSSEKDKVELDESNIVEAGNIDLSSYTSDLTIIESGTYTFSGKFSHSIIVDAKDQDVILVLDGVEIENNNTATIIGLSANKITINLAEGSENLLNDGGNSEYDGCIFSNAELIFEGSGKLVVNGNQNEGEGIATEEKNITINSGTIIISSNDDGINAGGDGATITINGGTIYIDASGDGIDSNKNAIINGGTLFVMGSDISGDAGIDTDEGYTINGGFVVALGSDMIEIPEESSKQKTIAFTLSEKIDKDTIITLMKDDEVIVSFEAIKSFKTIIISNDALDDGSYLLYKGGSNTGTLEHGIYYGGKYTKGNNIEVNNETIFNISKMVNTFGSSR